MTSPDEGIETDCGSTRVSRARVTSRPRERGPTACQVASLSAIVSSSPPRSRPVSRSCSRGGPRRFATLSRIWLSPTRSASVASSSLVCFQLAPDSWIQTGTWLIHNSASPTTRTPTRASSGAASREKCRVKVVTGRSWRSTGIASRSTALKTVIHSGLPRPVRNGTPGSRYTAFRRNATDAATPNRARRICQRAMRGSGLASVPAPDPGSRVTRRCSRGAGAHEGPGRR
jgi:hypothetical protein